MSDAHAARPESPSVEARQVTVTLPDGATRTMPAGSSSADLAADISKSLAKAAIAAKAHFVLSLKTASEVEQRSNLSLYAQFPYRG